MSTTIVTGAGGYVGAHVLRAFPQWIGLNRSHGDLTTLGEGIVERRPTTVIHLAALSRVDVCEKNPQEAHRVNVEGTRVIAQAAERSDARLIHVSTDQVFSGREGPYREEDEVAPITVYGESKAEGERVALASAANVTVVRLNLVVGPALPPRKSGSDSMVEALRVGKTVPLFRDEWRSPIHVKDVASALGKLVETKTGGILHLGGPQRLSRLDLGRMVLGALDLDQSLIQETSLSAYEGPPRAPDTSFTTEKWDATVGYRIRPLAEALGARDS